MVSGPCLQLLFAALVILALVEPCEARQRGTITVIPAAGSYAGREESLPLKPEDYRPPLQERIFNEKLTKEFDERYRQTFGATEAEQNYRQPSRVILANTDGVYMTQAEEDTNKRHAFAQYMTRRLAEYHLDNYAKNDPQVRPAWELKERISQVEVEVVRGYKVEGKYSFSGNLFEVKLENPYVYSKATLEFGGEGPSRQPEATCSVSKDVTKRVVLETYYKIIKDQIALVGTREMAPGLTFSLTGSAVGKSEPEGRSGEKLVLAGVAWNY